MVVRDQLQEIILELLSLHFGHIVDVAKVSPESEQGLPPCYGVGADERVDGSQVLANVLGVSAGFSVERQVLGFGDFVEPRLGVGSSEVFEEFAVRG